MKLKPCPNCGSEAITPPAKYDHYANCRDCGVFGPHHDPDGEKWNAMPRRGDAADADFRLLVETAARFDTVLDKDDQWVFADHASAVEAARKLIDACRKEPT